MSFLSPLFLAGAIAAAVPIVLHLLNRHTEQRVPFAAVALLKGAPVEHTSRRRLRELLLLAMRVAALVLLALAFARPFLKASSAAGDRLTVIAIDTSLSMSAPATVARARRLAADAVHAAPAGADVGLVRFADRAEVIIQPTSDRGAASAALERVAPGFGSTKYAAGLATAAELFAGRSGTIVVVTDLQAGGWDAGDQAAVPESVRVDVRDVGPAPENLAVEALRADGDRVIASVRNTSERARSVRTRLTVDGHPAGDTTIMIDAHGSAEATLPRVPSAGVAVATIDDPGGIPGDNIRYALLGKDSTTSALVVTTTGDLDKDAWYVRHALITPRGTAASLVGRWNDEDLRDFGSIVVLSTRGLERPGREQLAKYVNRGGGLLIAAGPDVDGEVIADVLGSGAPIEIKGPNGDPERVAAQQPQTLAPADVRHPIFKAFGAEVASLGLVQFRAVARVTGPSCQAIARFTSGDPAVLDCAAGNGHAIVIASDLNDRWNDFPIHASFVPFVDQAVRYLSGTASRGSEYLVSEVPAEVPPIPGVATVKTGSGTRRVVVNVDPRESQVDRMSPEEFQASIAHLQGGAAQKANADTNEQENRQHLWQYLLAAMILAVAVEGVVAARMA